MGIESNQDWLRVRFSHNKKRYCFNLGLKDTKSNRRKASQIYLQIEADIEDGTFDSTLSKYKPHPTLNKPLNTLTCSELFAEYLKWKSAFCDPRSIRWHTFMSKPLQRYFADVPASSIDQKQAKEFTAWIAPKARGETQRRRLRAINSCWDWAIENNYLTTNPWKETLKLIKASPVQMPKPFTADEVSTILRGFIEYYPALYPFVRFLFTTGCRLGEARALRWQDLSENCQTCEIVSQLSPDGKHSKLPKNGKTRTLQLTDSLAAILKELKSISGSNKLVFEFCQQPIIEDTFRHQWRRVLRKKKVPYRKPYNTRHTFVSHALAQGGNPMEICQQTGHSPKILFAHYAGYIKANPKLPELF